MAERGLAVDHSTVARWVLHYGPILNDRIRREMRHPNRSWRVDETYIRVSGKWTYLYRAIDSTGNTIDFRSRRSGTALRLKRFSSLRCARPVRPGRESSTWTVNRHIPELLRNLKRSGELGRNCRCRLSSYLNKLIEQDHRFVKKRVVASQWFRSVEGALNTIAGYEAINIIRKGQIRWLPKDDTVGQMRFVDRIFGIAA